MTVRPAGTGYRAFISYSRSDGVLAEALAAALTRFARPWYSTRAMRVFIDRNALSTDESLRKAIERGLERSEWLVLLASPASAKSPWVKREVAWWIKWRSPARLIIAQTDGTITWDASSDTDFDWNASTALPPVLRGAFKEVPLWTTLALADPQRPPSLADDAFRRGFLAIAARLHGMSSPDALWSKEGDEQRLRVRAVCGALALIAALLLGARTLNKVSKDRKENLASQQLGAKGFLLLPDDPQLAAQVALAGIALRPSGIAASALRSAVARIAGAVPPAFVLTVPGAIDLAYAPDGQRLAVLARDGRITMLDAAQGRVLAELAAGAPFVARAIAWGAGNTLAVAADDGLRLWSLAGSTTPAPRVLALPAVRALDFCGDGQRLALAHADGSVRIVDPADGSTVQRFMAHPGGARAVAYSPNGRRVASGGENGEAVLWTLQGERAELRVQMAAPIVSLDFNEQGSSTLAKTMLAVADLGGAVRVLDASPGSSLDGAATPRFADFRTLGSGVAARFVGSGRCLARVGSAGPIEVDATLGFEPLFTLGAPATVPTRAVALAQTSHFARLDAAGLISAYEQPLCGDAEAVCRFAAPRLGAPITAQDAARWIPGDVDLRAPVQQPAGPNCRALIDSRLLRDAGRAR